MPGPSPAPASGQGPARPYAGQAYLLLTVAALAWGGNVVASRFAIGEISPMVLTCLRWGVVVVVFGLLGPRRIVDAWPALRLHWRFGLAMGACGYTVFSAVLYVAAYYTTAVNLAILQGAVPIMVFVGAIIWQGARVDLLQVMGVAAALAGVLVVASGGDLQVLATLGFNGGDLIMLVGCACYAAYTLALRHRPDVSALSFFLLMAAGAFVSGLPLMAIEIVLGKAQWPTLQGWAVLLFVGLAPSLIAQRAFIHSVELIGPSRAGLFLNLIPIFGAFLSVLILGEAFGLYHALALGLVLGGILLAEHRTLSWSKRTP